MGTRGREILGIDVSEVLRLLNRAFSDEWLAYYQYWLGAKLVKGPMKDAVAAELLQHATEELAHADLVANRIIQLQGKPVTQPKLWYEWTGCGYHAPEDDYVGVILDNNIDGERCAIDFYDQLVKITRDKDTVTYSLAMTILDEEVQHEEDLQALREDLELLVSRAQGR